MSRCNELQYDTQYDINFVCEVGSVAPEPTVVYYSCASSYMYELFLTDLSLRRFRLRQTSLLGRAAASNALCKPRAPRASFGRAASNVLRRPRFPGASFWACGFECTCGIGV